LRDEITFYATHLADAAPTNITTLETNLREERKLEIPFSHKHETLHVISCLLDTAVFGKSGADTYTIAIRDTFVSLLA